MSTPSGDPGGPWTRPGDPATPVPQPPDSPDSPAAPPVPSGYGTPSSPSYGRYGQGQALPSTPVPPAGPPAPGQWGQAPWGRPGYLTPPDRQSGPGRFRAVGGLGRAVVVLSTVLTVLFWLSALLAPSARRSYQDAVAEGRSVTEVVTAYGLLGLVAYPVLISVWIVTCVWLSRARDNALLIDPRGQRRAPAWAWLGWLVPIVSLWFPKQILDDTIKATAPAAGRPPVSTDGYWAAWLAVTLLSALQFVLTVTADPEDSVIVWLEFAVAITTTVALVLWVIVVRRVSAIQNRLATSGAVRPD
jgi:hypothetical protein